MNMRLELETRNVRPLFIRLQYKENTACQLAPTCFARAPREMHFSASVPHKVSFIFRLRHCLSSL